MFESILKPRWIVFVCYVSSHNHAHALIGRSVCAVSKRCRGMRHRRYQERRLRTRKESLTFIRDKIDHLFIAPASILVVFTDVSPFQGKETNHTISSDVYHLSRLNSVCMPCLVLSSPLSKTIISCPVKLLGI